MLTKLKQETIEHASLRPFLLTFKGNNMFEHEKNMEHPMYKKGFQYVFDHYGVPEKPSEELIRLRKELKLRKETLKLYNEIKNTNITLIKEADNILKVNSKLDLSRNYYKKTLTKLRAKHKVLTSKWYVKLFVYLESKIRYITN